MKISHLLENKNLGLTIFDIDETLFRTTAQIKVVRDGNIIKSLTNQEFNNYELQPGEDFDFGEFRNAEKFNRESIPIEPMIAKLKAILRNAGDSKVVMLTARSDFDNKDLFLDTFRKYGIDINRIHVHRAGNLGGAPAQNKEVFIRRYLDTGDFGRVRLYDDSMANIRMFNALSKEYPDIQFFPYFVTHEGGIKTVREEVNTNNKSGLERALIDNKNGWGAVPNNQEVDYLGLSVTMTPNHFIDLAAPLDGEPSNKIAQHIEQGGTIGSPFLQIEIPESWEDGDFAMPARVVGHEGRNRMLAVAKVLGNNPVETHLFFSKGLRNRHITDEFKKNLNRGLVKEKSKSIVRGPFFSLTERIKEDGRIVKGVNTTVDVGPNEIKTQAAKFGNKVDRDGRPPTMTKKTKGSSTNVLFNLGLAESINPELLDKDFYKEKIVDTKAGKVKLVAKNYPSNMIPQIKVEAFIEDKSIGQVRFVVAGNDEPVGFLKKFKKADPHLVAGNLRVEDEYQRKGIATAMYQFVKNMGNDIKPSSSQTDQGKAFWKSKPNESVLPRYTAAEWAIIEGGHTLEISEPLPKKPGKLFAALTEGIKLRLERDEEIDVLHIMDTDDNSRIEVRGKKGYETNGYDPQDKLHQVLDKVGKAANISELMNGELVSINPRHPQGEKAIRTAKDVLQTESRKSVFSSLIEAETHTVQAGDTLYDLARQYNVSIEDLQSWNSITGNNIRLGQELFITEPQASDLGDTRPRARPHSFFNNHERILIRTAKAAGIQGRELAQFLAQFAHETEGFTQFLEQGSRANFRKYEFSDVLGNTQEGDGYRYIGRGYVQLTGRYNYQQASEALGYDFINIPQLAERPSIAAQIAVWYWNWRVRRRASDPTDTREVTRLIQGGSGGLRSRQRYFELYVSRMRLLDQEQGDFREIESVHEAFDTEAEWVKDMDNGGIQVFATKIDDAYIELTYKRMANDDVYIAFSRGGRSSVTGEGSQNKIFGAVINHIKDHVKNLQPPRIVFSAFKPNTGAFGTQDTTRSSLYRRMVQRFATQNGYDYDVEDTGNEDTFILTKQNTDTQTTEALDQPYPVRWNMQTDEEWFAWAKDDKMQIQIKTIADGRWSIRFKVGEKMDKTGEGDQFRIFATVVAAIKEWWAWASKNAEVDVITFSAEKIVDVSRSKLYNRFAQQFARAIGYDMEVVSGRATDIFYLKKPGLEENFADGKKPGRKGLAKRSGVNTKASVSSLRKTAKNSSGEKQRMAHWLANMKAGRAKKK